MGKNKKETFLLSTQFNETLSFEQLIDLTKIYEMSMEETNVNFPMDIGTIGFMSWTKRNEISFGPYQNLSFFEISNRIYSDIVILKAAQILFEEHSIKSIKLSMSNKAGNDMTITDKDERIIIGEAFNSACSFFQTKLRNELKKFDDGKDGFIAFNETALDTLNTNYFETKKSQYPNVKFIVCEV